MVGAFIAAEPPGIPRLENIAVDDGVLAFTIVIATLCGVGFGLLPSWRASVADPAEALRRGGARGGTGAGGAARHALVVAEVGLAFVLVVGAGLMSRRGLGDAHRRAARVLSRFPGRAAFPAGETWPTDYRRIRRPKAP
jgi:hypothetical protein